MIVLAGKNNIAVDALNFVLGNYASDVGVVVNATDSGVDGWQRSLLREARERDVPVISLEDAYRKASVFVSLEYDRIVVPEKFQTPFCYNIHFSLLPKYKGMYTSVWPILQGEERTGVTLHKIDNGIDTGEIISQQEIDIGCFDRARDLYRKYLLGGKNLFFGGFDSMIGGKLESRVQGFSGSSYYSRRSIDFSNVSIDLNKTAFEIRRQVYAFSFREYQLPLIYGRRIAEVEILDARSKRRPGEILRQADRYIEISAIDYDCRLYFDNISEIERFACCDVSEVKDLLMGLCGVHDRNASGWSPVIYAASSGNIDVVDGLLRLGADANDVSNDGKSVLMHAADFSLKRKDRAVFDLLLEWGADPCYRDRSGRTLFDHLRGAAIDFLGV